MRTSDLMFTGIVTDIGEVAVGAEPTRAAPHPRSTTAYDPAGIAIGASIACSGAA